MTAKLLALRSTNCLFLKFAIKHLSNNGPTALIAHVVRNMWAFLFLKKFVEIITSFYKKY